MIRSDAKCFNTDIVDKIIILIIEKLCRGICLHNICFVYFIKNCQYYVLTLTPNVNFCIWSYICISTNAVVSVSQHLKRSSVGVHWRPLCAPVVHPLTSWGQHCTPWTTCGWPWLLTWYTRKSSQKGIKMSHINLQITKHVKGLIWSCSSQKSQRLENLANQENGNCHGKVMELDNLTLKNSLWLVMDFPHTLAFEWCLYWQN